MMGLVTVANLPPFPVATQGLIMPPDNFNDWYKLVYAFATQLVKRYGLAEVRTWKFEVWNGKSLNKSVGGLRCE